MKRFSNRYWVFLLVTPLFVVHLDSSLWGQENSGDRIFFHAKVFTGDSQSPYAEAVAIRGDKIIAVGTLPEVVKSASANAERVDLVGKSLFPGFIDSHSHSIDGGLTLIAADASEKVNSLDELPAFAADAKQTGRGMRGDILEIFGMPLAFWSHTDVLNADFSRGTYEKQSVLLRGMDGHTSWANRTLLQRAGITADFLKRLSVQERSYYGVDKNGQPNGFLVDAGEEKIDALLPAPTPEKLLAAGRAALEYNYSLGITAWLDPLAADYVLQAYKMLADRGELRSQVVAFPQVLARDPAAELATVQKTRETYKDVPNLHVTGIKVFADGVVEYPSQTAHLSKPYKNTGRNGDLLFDPGKFAELCIAADKQGLIIHVHAIGDLAVKEALDGIAAARNANGNSGLPHTLTHEQFVQPEDFPRFRELGVVSALQLFWADASQDTIEIVKPYLDPEIYKSQYPARSILDNGGIISGASDWPVSTANVFRAIYQAETRKGPEGVLDAAQAMPREAMFFAYTQNSARAMNLDSIGTIASGKRADLVLLDRDVLTISPEEMRNARVLWTMVAGKIVYRAK
ncbi:MAG TPA: amidohydrolase [Candidatus Eremiobacteraceae bacterium]|nr:amidohydrolase [Candidatus Eremiobacteraceae bacterium]